MTYDEVADLVNNPPAPWRSSKKSTLLDRLGYKKARPDFVCPERFRGMGLTSDYQVALMRQSLDEIEDPEWYLD